MKVVSQGLSDGSIVHREDVYDGLENAPEAFIGMLHGKKLRQSPGMADSRGLIEGENYYGEGLLDRCLPHHLRSGKARRLRSACRAPPLRPRVAAFLCRNGAIEVHEDGVRERTVIVEFDSFDQARAAYHAAALSASTYCFGRRRRARPSHRRRNRGSGATSSLRLKLQNAVNTMPWINLTLRRGALSKNVQHAMMARLTETLMWWEKVPDTPKARSIMKGWVYEVDADADYNAGRPGSRKAVLFRGSQDTYRQARRAIQGRADPRLHTQVVLDAEGAPNIPENARRVWVTINEIKREDWGVGGHTDWLRGLYERVGRDRR